MDIPLEIAFHNVEPSAEIESLIRSGRRRVAAFTRDQLESARLAV